MPKERLKLRSINADVCAHVQFYNSTNRRLHAYWIDYNGWPHIQFALDAKTNRSINTFLTHPWLFRDAATGELMQVNHSNVFLPQIYTVPDPRNPTQRLPCRKQIIIHLPLQTLKDLCLWTVGALLHKRESEINANVSIINQLEIPFTLKRELKLMLRLRVRLNKQQPLPQRNL